MRATLRLQWDGLDGAARDLLQVTALLGEGALAPLPRLALLTGMGLESSKGRPAPLRRALRELDRRSLVEELLEERLRLHPLVREFALGEGRPDVSPSVKRAASR